MKQPCGLENGCLILLADDEAIVRRTLGDYLKDSGHRVEFADSGESAVALAGKGNHDLALLDIRMPDIDGIEALGRIRSLNPEIPVVMISGHGNMDCAVQVLRMGATDFLTKPVKLRELDTLLEKTLAIRTLRRRRHGLDPAAPLNPGIPELRCGSKKLIGDSPQTRSVRDLIRRAARSACDTILVTGETGTGKEVVARNLHAATRPDGSPFVAVCCPALSGDLLESELFGHVRGAFTGADRARAGHFEIADGGTLFLDEVADLTPAAQATLLRVLETRRFRRVGGEKEIAVDVRIMAATNVPLEELIADGAFRRDLYYRLNLFTIALHPLRERRQDILPLARYFLDDYARSRRIRSAGFSPRAERLLAASDYPGNGRELRNIVERALILAGEGMIETRHLDQAALNPPALPRPASPDRGKARPASRSGIGSGDEERQAIIDALESSRWNRKAAAHLLDMPYSTLRYKILKYEIR